MAILAFGRGALGVGLAVFLLSGCGGSQTGLNAGNKTTMLSAQPPQAGATKAFTSQDLLYVGGICGGVCIFAYPSGKYVASISVPQSGFMCTDTGGDVFVTVPQSESVGYIYEYAHGGTQPIQTLSDSGFPYGCSVDPTTGNLAVANYFAPGSKYGHGNVAIYANAQGTPTYYKDPNIYWYQLCSYDRSGNLLVNGNAEESFTPYAVLPKGSSTFTDITFDESVGFGPIQWDGQHFAIGTGYEGSDTISQVSISGSKGTVVSQTQIIGPIKHVNIPFWIQANKVILLFRPDGRRASWLGYWKYPSGGKPLNVLKRVGGQKLPPYLPYGIAISAASSPQTPRAGK